MMFYDIIDNPAFEGLSSFHLIQREFLKDYSAEHWMPETHDRILDNIDTIDNYNLGHEINNKARDYLETAFEFIPQEAMLKFMEQEEARLGSENFYEYYHIANPEDIFIYSPPYHNKKEKICA